MTILKESENFISHERFNYFRKYKNKNNIYLEIINKILLIKKKDPLKSLENYNMELAEEEIEFFKTSLNQKNSEFQRILDENREKEEQIKEVILENSQLKKEINNLKDRANRLSNKLDDKENMYQKKIIRIFLFFCS